MKATELARQRLRGWILIPSAIGISLLLLCCHPVRGNGDDCTDSVEQLGPSAKSLCQTLKRTVGCNAYCLPCVGYISVGYACKATCDLCERITANHTQRTILHDFYITTNGRGWIDSTGWLDKEYCYWTGINCDSNGNVVFM